MERDLSTESIDIRFLFGYIVDMAPILPRKKKETLAYIEEYIHQNGFAPTLTDIAKHFHLSSLATAHEHLTFLEQKGFIKRHGHDGKALTIVNQSDTSEIKAAEMLIPLVGVIAAGSPIEAIEDVVSSISVPESISAGKPSYALRVKGDSMIDNFILDGDCVLISKTKQAKNGDTVVALLEDGTATLKEFYKEKDRVRLQPANKQYKPIYVRNVDIQGKVVGIIRAY